MPDDIQEESEFCSCGKHFSECSCGETRHPPTPKGKKGPWGLPWRPTPDGYDEETFYK